MGCAAIDLAVLIGVDGLEEHRTVTDSLVELKLGYVRIAVVDDTVLIGVDLSVFVVDSAETLDEFAVIVLFLVRADPGSSTSPLWCSNVSGSRPA